MIWILKLSHHAQDHKTEEPKDHMTSWFWGLSPLVHISFYAEIRPKPAIIDWMAEI